METGARIVTLAVVVTLGAAVEVAVIVTTGWLRSVIVCGAVKVATSPLAV